MIKKLTGLFLLFSLAIGMLHAKQYAYVYIEGDKETPFYVKVEGQMMPRLGKNYFILPNLDEGVTNIEVLFQQNAYPTQKFKINVPSGGARGFLLRKVNEEQFSLYDLLQGSTLLAGNSAEDDVYIASADENTRAQEVATVEKRKTAVNNSEVDALPDFEPEKVKKTTSPKTEKPAKEKVTKEKLVKEKKQKETLENEPDVEPTVTKEETKPKDRFLSDIEFNAQETSAENKANTTKTKANQTGKTQSKKTDNSNLAALSEDVDTTPVENTESNNDGAPATSGRCATPITNEAFEQVALRVVDAGDDNARLKALKKQSKGLCFTTEQVRIIANSMDTQSARYEVARDLYQQVYDLDNFPKLESLFKTNYLKEKFKDLLQ